VYTECAEVLHRKTQDAFECVVIADRV
jgi:hypothetical protein